MQPIPELKEIRKRRERLRISQRKLANDLGISQSTIAKIESGKTNPTYRVVVQIFEHLDSVNAVNMGKAVDIASRPVVSVRLRQTVRQVVGLLQARGYKQLPVLEGNRSVGSVSERGISRRIMETNEPEAVLRRRVGAVLDDALPTVPEDLHVEGVVVLLQHAQAVLTTRRGRVTGIITNADLLKMISRRDS
jgi:predicted transcriptional regulator